MIVVLFCSILLEFQVKNFHFLAMPVKLYSYWRSSCSWRVRICLALKNLKYECIPIHLVRDGGEQHKEDYKAHNPMEQVPCFVNDEISLTQSMAIMEYLDEKYDGHALLPKDLVKRAKVRELCEIINSGIQPIQNLSVLQKIGDTKVEWANNAITVGFVALEQKLSTCAGKYSVDDDITMADACLVPQVMNAERFKVDMNRFPIITRINKTLLEHPAVIESGPKNQIDCPEK